MNKLFILLLFCLAASLQAGQVFYVVPGGAGSKNGLTWANAFADVQTAINSAAAVATDESPSEVWIKAGTYKQGSEMAMKNNVAIYGGFAGTETDKEQRIAGENKTYLDGEESYRIFNNNYTQDNPLTNSAKLDNVTIQNGKVTDVGGGMYNNRASPEITNCTFSGNTSSYGGGGMYNNYSSPEITNCTFSGNTASSSGGGGMYNNYSSPEITNCTFSGNTTSSDGGGMRNIVGNPKLTNCTFSGNTASSYGGGMYNTGGSPTLTNCTFSGNTTSSGGGGMYNNSGSPTLTNCTFSGNNSSAIGRGGGGMYNNSGSPTLTNCTFSGNTASSNGGGMYNSGKPTVTNCIFWEDAASLGKEIYNDGSDYNPNFDTCIIKGGKGGIYNTYGTYTNIITIDPNLKELGDYGGDVQTMPAGVGSSAIGAGKVVEGVETDARGVARSTTAPTIGAVECIETPITLQPVDTAVAEGNNAVFSTLSDAPGVTYQWQYSTDGNNWSIIDDATEATLTINNVEYAQNGYKYRCILVSDITYLRYSDIATLTVNIPPAIITQPENIEAYAGTEGSLSVVSEGGRLTYQWYKNGEAIEGATEATLNFESIQASDSGPYYCVVTNSLGSVQSDTASVVVKPAPEITTQPADLIIYANNSGSLTVEASGDGLTHQWYKNGEAIEGATEAVLNFASAQVSDAGSYYCVVNNPAGSAQSNTATVTVKLAPAITVQPVNTSFFVNDNISLTVEASGDGLTYQWYKNGASIAGATAATLTLENIQISSAGSYYCVVSNPAGSVQSSTASITAKPKPAITTQPTDLTIYANNNGSLSVVATGDSLSYQWYKDGFAIEYATESSLNFENIQEANAGDYHCVVSNPAGSTQSDVVSVAVKSAPAITIHPADLTIYANNSGSLSVVASGDSLTYQWYKNDEAVAGATSAILNFENIQEANSGSYYCVVSNPAGSAQSDIASVVVKSAPAITIQPISLTIFANNSGSLGVVATGDELTYQWYKNGAPVEGETEATLEFENIQAVNAGSYYCVVSNPAGSVQSSTASLVVKPAPAIGTQPSDLEIYTDKSGSLVIVATGEELTYQWYKGGAAIVGATSATLNFTNIQEASSGSYYCVVSNPGGSVQSSSATVAVWQSANAGSITKPLSSVRTVASVGFARFEIETSAYNPTYKWYWGSDTAGWTQFAGETSNILFIPAESQYNRKSVKCEVSNGGGTAESSAVLVYSSAAVQITSQPQDVSCSAGDNVSFTVAATTSTGEAFYQWQYSANGEDWENIEGATAATHSFKMDDLSKRGYYRCEIDNGGGVLYSEKASLSCGISIITQPQDVSAFAGKEAEVSILVGEIAGIAYQWQISNDGVIWNNIAGATAAKYRFTMQTAMNGYKCRCKLSASGIDDVYSDSANITLLEDVVIIQQPQVIPSAVRGSKATFSIGASGYEPQYQWQVSYDFGDTWENIAGAEGASYSITATDEIVENSYRCLVWNANNVDSPLESEMVWVEDVVDPSGYDKWAIDNGLSGDDALPTAIPHSDGIMNLEKFAFGLDGSKAASYADNPHFAQSVEGGAASISFPISVDAEGNVSVKALMSTDLINWTETPATATGTSKDGKFKLYKATAEIPEGGKVFLKLKVEQ